MALKHHTVIFVPHGRSQFRKWRISHRQLLTVVGAALLIAVASIFTSWSFFTTQIDKQELASIREENESLRAVNSSFEDSIRALQGQLAQFEDRTRKLAIVAGLEAIGASSEAGVGGEIFETDESADSTVDSILPDLDKRTQSISQSLTAVSDRLDERMEWIASTPAIAPVKGILTSGYGNRRDPITGRSAWHPAVDIATAPGRPVKAPADALVTRSGRIGGLGKAVYLSHGYGLTTRYGHLSRLNVQPGERVSRGDVIGFVGNTGRSTGYHLHYEVRIDGETVNPLAYILDSVVDGG